ncbi:MAG TPA: PAS domain-containing protein [Chitinophagaceae bacterium]|nr:PAS domain-containing protein [Chitinophagaceae bacterium]
MNTQEPELIEKLAFSFIRHTQHLFWMVDEEGSLVYANKPFYKYFGIGEEALQQKIVELLPKEVGGALYQDHLRVLNTDAPLYKEQRVKWADGTSLVFLINLFPIDGTPGKKLLGGHAVNLASKHSIEKQLREANDKLLRLNRVAANAIWEWDMRTGQIFRNEPLLDMIGYPIENTHGLAWWLQRIHPEDRNRVSDLVKDTAEKKLHAWEDSYRFKCADGSYKHIRDRGFIVYENELPVKMIGSLQDVTDIKILKEKLLDEKMERQKEISEMVIQVQEKERTRIGHELHDNVNQLLTASKLFVEMMAPRSEEENGFKQKGIEYVVMAIEEIRKLSKELVVPQLKDRGLVISVQNMIDDMNIAQKIKISFAHDGNIDLLTPGRKLTMFRIIQEQLKNIFKYSKATVVNIYMHRKNGDVQLVIRDNGIGFDSAKTYTGVGLNSIHERTRFYNGTVDIQTSPGSGCKMTITIPVH